MCSFLVKFASVISWALSCFDRVLFKGHLPISRPYEIENFVDYVLKMRRADFMEKLAPCAKPQNGANMLRTQAIESVNQELDSTIRDISY